MHITLIREPFKLDDENQFGCVRTEYGFLLWFPCFWVKIQK